MKLDEMELFVHVAELGSFTKAADYCDLPKSSVSRRVKELEDSLKVRLLDRTTRSLKLTPQGELFYQRAKEILGEIEQVQQDLSSEQATATGTITVYAPTMIFSVFADWFMQFKQSYPDIQLELMTLDPSNVLSEDTRFDLLIRPGQQPDSSMIVRQIALVPVGYYASPKYLAQHGPIATPQALEQHQIIFHPINANELPQWEFEKEGEKVIVPLQPDVTTNNTLAMLEFALAGAGVVRSPGVLAESYVKAGQLVPLFDDKYHMHAPLFALYPSRRYMPERVRLLLNYLIEELPQAIDDLV